MDMVRDEEARLIACLMEMGELLLDCGAEISRVEDTLTRIGTAYGAVMNVFVIPSLITITMNFQDRESISETRRIRSYGTTDFYRLEKLNAMSRECCVSPIPIAEFRARLYKVAAGKKPFPAALFGSILAAGGFAVFFGGNLWDGLVSAIFGACICLLQRRIGRTELNTAASNLLVSLLIGLGVGLTTELIPALHMDKILIGDIMLLIPGLTMTNAVRNILVGNTISGVVRLAETLIWSAALAGGFMMALAVVNMMP